MKVRKNIATSDEGFIFNPTNGDSFSTNAIGADIIQHLKQEKSTKEIVNLLVEKYDVDAYLLECDIEEFAIQLKDFGLIES